MSESETLAWWVTTTGGPKRCTDPQRKIRDVDPTGHEIEFSSHLKFRVEDGAPAEMGAVAERLGGTTNSGLVEPSGHTFHLFSESVTPG